MNHQNEFGKAAIHRAVEYDQEKIVDLLIAHGADVNSVDYYGRTPLYMASRNNNQKIVQSLVTANNVDINLSDKTGKTPLDRARERGEWQ